MHVFQNAMKDFPMAEQRKLFGYPAAFVNGQMFTGLYRGNMILRLADTDRAKFIAEYKTKLFEPMPGRPMKEYVLVPQTILKSPTLLTAWVGRALAYAQSLPPKVKAKKTR